MDLLNLDSIDTFAAAFLASGRPLHILIYNAGIMFVEKQIGFLPLFSS
jgi:NAD(P)-dependent dehydrogenase (short-subunit alcohol dehydrogenase family)